MGPDYLPPMPDIKLVTKIHSSGVVEERLYDKNGHWEYDKIYLEDGSFGGFKSWNYDAQTQRARIYLVEPEDRDTITCGWKRFNREGNLVEEKTIFPESEISTLTYQYSKNNCLILKQFQKNDGKRYETVYFRDTLDDCRIDSLHIFENDQTKGKFLAQKQIFTYDTDTTYSVAYYDEKNDFLKPTGVWLFSQDGYRLKNITPREDFDNGFSWPDSSLYVSYIDSLIGRDTVEFKIESSGRISNYRMVRSGNGKNFIVSALYPGTSYEMTTYRKESRTGQIIEEGQFRVNAERDTLWVGGFRHKLDDRGRLIKRTIYANEPGFSDIRSETLYTYSDSSVTILKEFETKKLRQRIETEKPDIHSHLIYSITRKVWDDQQDNWVVLSREKHDYDAMGREIFFEDDRQQIFRRFNEYGVCIEEEVISKLGELPKRWELDISFYK